MGNQRKKSVPAKAFTLIELLVVIAIIALLLAILMPSLQKVKKIAGDVICRTNMKTMQLATVMYTNAYAGKMPEYSFGQGLWMVKLEVFMDKVNEARYCARSKRREELMSQVTTYSFGNVRKDWVWYWDGMEEGEPGSYSMNSWFFSSNTTDDRYYRNAASVEAAYNIPVFADSIWVDGRPTEEAYPQDGNLYFLNTGMGRLITYRHEDKTNVGFLDGSQRPVKLGDLWTLKWHANFKNQGWMTRPDGTEIYQKKYFNIP